MSKGDHETNLINLQFVSGREQEDGRAPRKIQEIRTSSRHAGRGRVSRGYRASARHIGTSHAAVQLLPAAGQAEQGGRAPCSAWVALKFFGAGPSRHRSHAVRTTGGFRKYRYFHPSAAADCAILPDHDPGRALAYRIVLAFFSASALGFCMITRSWLEYRSYAYAEYCWLRTW